MSLQEPNIAPDLQKQKMNGEISSPDQLFVALQNAPRESDRADQTPDARDESNPRYRTQKIEHAVLDPAKGDREYVRFLLEAETPADIINKSPFYCNTDSKALRLEAELSSRGYIVERMKHIVVIIGIRSIPALTPKQTLTIIKVIKEFILGKRNLAYKHAQDKFTVSYFSMIEAIRKETKLDLQYLLTIRGGIEIFSELVAKILTKIKLSKNCIPMITLADTTVEFNIDMAAMKKRSDKLLRELEKQFGNQFIKAENVSELTRLLRNIEQEGIQRLRIPRAGRTLDDVLDRMDPNLRSKLIRKKKVLKYEILYELSKSMDIIILELAGVIIMNDYMKK